MVGSYVEVNNEEEKVKLRETKKLDESGNEIIKENLKESIKKETVKESLKENVKMKVNENDNQRKDVKKVNKKDSSEEKKEDEREEIEQIRIQKLMNSKDNNRKVVVFQFLFFCSLIIIFFVISYMMEHKFLSTIREIFDLEKILGDRPSILKYTLAFTFEEIGTKTPNIYKGISSRIMYLDKIYSNEAKIVESLSKTLPSNFNEYKNKFLLINYNDICSNFFPQSEKSKIES